MSLVWCQTGGSGVDVCLHSLLCSHALELELYMHIGTSFLLDLQPLSHFLGINHGTSLMCTWMKTLQFVILSNLKMVMHQRKSSNNQKTYHNAHLGIHDFVYEPYSFE